MSNLFDIFGGARRELLVGRLLSRRAAGFPTAGCRPRGDRRADHWPVLAQLVGASTGVSAGWLGLFFGFALTWVMPVTAHQAGLDSPSARLALAQG